MSVQLKLDQLTDQPAMTLRIRTPMSDLPAAIGAGYGKIGAYLAQANQPPGGDPYVIYHNMDMNDLDVELGIPAAAALPGSGEVRPGVLPGGPAATCLYIGPYANLAEGYDAIQQWVDQEKLQPSGPVYEIYLNDPAVTPSEQLQTLIVFPLKA